MISNQDEFEAARARWNELVEGGHLEKALPLVEAALEWVAGENQPVLEARVRCNRARIAIELGLEGAYTAELRDVLVANADLETSFLAAYSLARFYELRKEARKARFYAQLANDRAEGLDAERQGSSLNQLANVLVAESRFDEAARDLRTGARAVRFRSLLATQRDPLQPRLLRDPAGPAPRGLSPPRRRGPRAAPAGRSSARDAGAPRSRVRSARVGQGARRAPPRRSARWLWRARPRRAMPRRTPSTCSARRQASWATGSSPSVGTLSCRRATSRMPSICRSSCSRSTSANW